MSFLSVDFIQTFPWEDCIAIIVTFLSLWYIKHVKSRCICNLRRRQPSKFHFNVFQLYKSYINNSLISLSEKNKLQMYAWCLDLTNLLKMSAKETTNKPPTKLFQCFTLRHQLKGLFPLVVLWILLKVVMGKLKVSGKCSLASILHSLSNKGFVLAMWSALQEASTPEKLRQYSGHGYIRFLPKDIFLFCHFYHSMLPCFFISSFTSGCEATTYQIPASFKNNHSFSDLVYRVS